MHVLASNRLEDLARAFAGRLLADPLRDPVAPEWVVVPSPGMERWLSMQVSQVTGVSANLRFSFPARTVRWLVASALATLDRTPPPDPESPPDDPWDPSRLTFAVLAELEARRDDPAFAPLRAWLGDTPRGSPVGRREYRLAMLIADLLDEYASFRPDWVRDWSAGGHAPASRGDWQPVIWRALEARIGAPHPAFRLREATAALASASTPVAGLPGRLTLFGVSALPPAFLDVLLAFSNRPGVDVRAYVLTPAAGYFGHCPTRLETLRHLAAHPGSTLTDLHLEAHPLVASMGKVARDFNARLTEACADVDDACVDPLDGTRPTMLRRVQSDVLNLVTRSANGPNYPVPLDDLDGSIRFHACHGPLRQVEVLRDEVLRILADNPDIAPRDVVVMCPDIDAYAPLIDAVFSEGQHRDQDSSGGGPGIPRLRFSMADRNPRGTNEAAEVLARVLAMPDGRMTASEVLDLLSLDAVGRRFSVSPADLETIRAAVRDSGARWGLDASHRERFLGIADATNTWRFGLDRLALGVAMTGEGRRRFTGVLPFDEVEGAVARVAGRFMRFCEMLFAASAEAARPRPAGAWLELVADLLDAFVDLPEERAWQAREVVEAFRTAAAEAEAARLDRPIALDAARALLDDRISRAGRTSGLLAGGITFCSLVPMRAIPFEVVCLLGMDDGAFPRKAGRPGFDLLARHPEPGDLNPRDEDRQLFLDAILSARRHLVICWTGKDARDNADLPPAVPVGELLDVVSRSFRVDGLDADGLRNRLVTHHPLQPFSPRAFLPGLPPSFDARALRGARASLGPRRPPEPFFDAPLPLPPDRVVSVDDLARFLEGPIRYLARDRMGVTLDADPAEVPDREPIELSGLEEWRIGEAFIEAMLAGEPTDAVRDRMRGEGALPLGRPGDEALRRVEAEAATVAEAVRAIDVGPRRAVDVDLALQVTLAGEEEGPIEMRVRGGLPRVHSAGQVLCGYARLSGRRVLAAWVRHMLACAAVEGFSGTTWVVGRERPYEPRWPAVIVLRGAGGDGPPSDRARAVLSDLLALYMYGCSTPLLLFPDSSCAFARASAEAGPTPPEVAASRAWRTVDEHPREDADPYHRWLFGDTVPWDPSAALPVPPLPRGFTPGQLALRVWGPVLAALGGAEETP